MAERTARLGSMHYRDVDGRYRTASAGEAIQVHPDYLERFDRLNVLAGQEPEPVEQEQLSGEKPAEPVKRRPGRPRKMVEE